MSRKEPWQECEKTVKERYEKEGYLTIPTRIGSDFLALKPTKTPTLVEVKLGCGGLSPTQREIKTWAEKVGLDYKIESCTCARRQAKTQN